MKSIAIAAERTMPDNRGTKRKQDCDPEIQRLIKIRKGITMRRNDDNIKEITTLIKKTVRRIRAKQFVKGFEENKWDFVRKVYQKRIRTRLNSRSCETSMEI